MGATDTFPRGIASGPVLADVSAPYVRSLGASKSEVWPIRALQRHQRHQQRRRRGRRPTRRRWKTRIASVPPDRQPRLSRG